MSDVDTESTTPFDIPHARDFFALIDPTTEQFQFQQIHDKNDRAAAPVHLSIDDLEQLEAKAENGFGTFFTVNYVPQGQRRTAGNVEMVRAIYADDDVRRPAPRTDWAIVPSITVESSPGKYHYYWLVDGEMDARTGEAIKRSIARDYGTDWAGVAGPNRVLRVPGFPHQKDKPFISRYMGGSQRYSAARLIETFGVVWTQPPRKGAFIGMDAAGDAMLAAMEEHDMIIRKKTDGEHWVVCPWADQHTDPRDRRANFLSAGTGEYPHPTFYCHHDSCCDKSNTDLADYLEICLVDEEQEYVWSLLADMPQELIDLNIEAVIEKNVANEQIPDDDPLGVFDVFQASEDQLRALTDASFWIQGFIPRGHVTLIAAPPNGGKSTLFWDYYRQKAVAGGGEQLVYINADIGASDAKVIGLEAIKLGIKLLLPDIVPGQNMRNVAEMMHKMTLKEGLDLSRTVFVIDTLKKMANVIEKRESRALMAMFRALTMRGATIILLAHTNKYPDKDGNLIYEGTGDLRSDVDNLIYLYPERTDDGVLVASKIDKARAVLEDKTWLIMKDRTVIEQDTYTDVKSLKVRRQEIKKDRMLIAEIRDIIESHPGASQKDILELGVDANLGARKTIWKKLNIYDGEFWESTQKSHSKEVTYTVIDTPL